MARILVVRDLKLRYRQTALGAVGVIIGPLITAGILSFVFGQIAKLPSEGVPYVVFAFAGMLGWNTFAGVLGRAGGSLLTDANLVARIFIPRILLPIAGVFIAMVDMLVSATILVGLMVVFGIAPGVQLLTLPIWIASLAALGMGLGATQAVLIVHYRDVGLATTAGLTVLQSLTPVAYSATAVPERYRAFYDLNPIAAIIEGLRWAILGTDSPSLGRAAISIGVCFVVLLIGLAVFNRMERGLADVI